MKWLKRLAALIVFLYLAVIVLFYVGQAKLIYYPTRHAADYAYHITAPYLESSISLQSGQKINYLILQAPSPKGTILYFHGNAGSLESWSSVAAELAANTGNEVWIFDYPGFGKSEGDLSTNAPTLFECGQILYEKIKRTNPMRPIYFMGRSLGTGIAGELSTFLNIDGLILESPYTTLRNLAADLYPWLPSFLLKLNMSNLVVKNSSVPKVLLFHGTNDIVIPYQHSLDLVKELGRKAQLITIPEGDHNDLSDFPEYWAGMDHFFSN